MKKKVLFVMESLRIGGAEKSLVTILSMLDREKYDLYLYLFRQSGPFLEQVPTDVAIIPVSDTDKVGTNFKTDWLTYLLHGRAKRSFYSLKWLLNCIISKYIKKEQEYIGWEERKHLHSDIPGHFDVAIGFLEKMTTYFVVDHVNAEKKIAFMHTDYDAIPHDKELDSRYFKQLDYLAVVSEHTKDTMVRHFPFMAEKTVVIKNMVSPAVIRHMAEDPCPEMENCPPGTLKIVTVGRLTSPKNIDGAVRIMEMLRNRRIHAEWFVVGEGEERENLEKQIRNANLNGKFHLVGARSNPYPFMKNCDIYVQPSRWEGFGITVAEAKVLCKPIVTSDIPEFREQIRSGENGLIGADEDCMTECICKIANDPKLKKSLIDILSAERIVNSELQKLDAMLESK